MTHKKMSLLVLFSMSLNSVVLSDTPNCASHTFVPRSVATDLVNINALTYYNRHFKEKDTLFTYAGQTIFSQSRKSKDLGAAFLKGTSNTIGVQQEPNSNVDTVNSVLLGLANANLDNPFIGAFSIKPQRKFFAYHGYMYVNLDSWWCGLWADAAFAIINVRHQLHCSEAGNTGSICPGISTITQALSNPELEFGKFFCGLCNNEKRRTGFDDFQVRLGYDYSWCDSTNIGIYAIGTIPGGRKSTAEFVFEPLVGSTHYSAGVGVHGDYQFTFCGCDDASFTVMTDANYRFVFSHNECRTFDLLPQGAFSRFLPLVNRDNPLVTIPGVNLLTQKVKVQPRGTIQWWLGLNYEYCDWDIEIGYNVWWRQKEKVKESSVSFPANTSVFDLTGDFVTRPLTLANIDVDSGLAARALTNKVYGAFSWTGCVCDCFDWMGGLGGSYEFVANHDRCAALQYWAVFGKCAVSF